MAEPARVASDAAGSLIETWRRLGPEQRVAAVAAILLIASTFGPFSFVELAMILTALGVLTLLRQRADRKLFHLPFGDGTVVFAAGIWAGLLIVVRLFDRPLGQSVLALVCAAVLAGAGARERAKRPADDLPDPPDPDRRPQSRARPAKRRRRGSASKGRAADTDQLTLPIAPADDLTDVLPSEIPEPQPPPELEHPRRPSGTPPAEPR